MRNGEIFLQNVKKWRLDMSTAINQIGHVCTNCVAIAITIASIAIVATLLWVLFL